MNFFHNQPAIASSIIYPMTFLVQDTTADFTVKAAVLPASKIIGVSQAGPKQTPGLVEAITGVAPSGEPAANIGDGIGIFGLGDVCLITVGSAAVAAGAFLKNDGNANAITATSGQYYGAVAWQAGQPGEKIQCQVQLGTVI